MGLAGCGGKAATRRDVIARGNAICSATLAAIRSVPPPAGTSASALATYLLKVRPLVDGEARKLAALPRPAARRATLSAFIAAVQATAHAYDQAAAAAARGDTEGVTTALASLRSNRVPQLAQRYGLTACTGAVATTGTG